MNVLLFALGSHGDVHPFVGIGIRLRQRGHRVAVAANGYFKPLVDHANLEFIECGTADEYRKLAGNADLWNPLRAAKTVFQGTARYLRPMYDIATAFAARGDAVIAASSLALGARVAQDKHGLRMASIHLSPAIIQSAHAAPKLHGLEMISPWAPLAVTRGAFRMINAIMDSLICPPLNAFRAEVGLLPVRGILSAYWHSPRLVVGLFPSWYAPPQPDWPPQVRLTGFPLYDEPDMTPMSRELINFIEAGDAPIAFTPGSAMWQAHRFFAASAEACVKLNRRGILLTRHRAHLPPRPPPGVIHVDYAPFSQLLPRCAAFVHHGGIGSTAQALASGVPQLVMPFTHDQPDNADRVKRLGVAEVVPASRYTADTAAAALKRLLRSPSIPRCCAAVKRRFENVDSVGQTCDLIESLASATSTSAATVTSAVPISSEVQS